MTEKYDFEFSGLNIGIIITASSIRGAFRILKTHAKYPHKFTLNVVIDRNGSDVITEQQKAEFEKLKENWYINNFEGFK